MYDLGEIIGRYVLTGAILYGALTLMLFVRLIWVAFRPGNGGIEFINSFNGFNSSGNTGVKKIKINWIRTAVEWIFYPCGLVLAVHRYLKKEQAAIQRMRELTEKGTG